MSRTTIAGLRQLDTLGCPTGRRSTKNAAAVGISLGTTTVNRHSYCCGSWWRARNTWKLSLSTTSVGFNWAWGWVVEGVKKSRFFPVIAVLVIMNGNEIKGGVGLCLVSSST